MIGYMKASIAVATVDGKAYFLVVNELKRRSIPFFSVVPGESLPVETKAVITTKGERKLIPHTKLLIYDPETDPETLGAEVVKVLLGKEYYESVIIGVDPGEVFGIATIADGQVIESENCFSQQETTEKILRTLRAIDLSKTAVTVKVGNGVIVYRSLVRTLDKELPSAVNLEVVDEGGTRAHPRESTNRRGIRHIVSATLIARRPGHTYTRWKTPEEDS